MIRRLFLGLASVSPFSLRMRPGTVVTHNDPIMEAIGQASMCWQYPERAGVFDSESASKVGEELRQRLRVFRSTSDAMDVLRYALQRDQSYAWSWHCNIAVSFQDEGGTHEQSNRAAARFMSTAFGVNVEEFDEWKTFDWQDARVDRA